VDYTKAKRGRIWAVYIALNGKRKEGKGRTRKKEKTEVLEKK